MDNSQKTTIINLVAQITSNCRKYATSLDWFDEDGRLTGERARAGNLIDIVPTRHEFDSPPRTANTTIERCTYSVDIGKQYPST